MKYLAMYKGRPFNAFHSNGNGTVKDIISFSWRCYTVFESIDRAKKYFQYHYNYLNSRTGDVDNKLIWKINKIINSLKFIKHEEAIT